MAAKTTPFQKTRFYIGTSEDVGKKITACSVTPNATITVPSSGFKTGDCVLVTGLGALDGYYPVKSVAADVITLADEVDWSAYDQPTVFTDAKAALVKWSNNFCELRNLERSEDTLTEEDVTTMCDDGKATEAGEFEYGETQMKFFTAPTSEMQKLCRKKFFSKSKFPFRLVFPNDQGTMYGTGYFKSGNGYSGETMGKFESGATIKHTKQEYHLPVD